ncbi:putative non-specific serine/threonine protein kinase [Helianthus annuus]|nr:putative non-specific serine/threonine protein kinase [Helianthus annuus]
MSFHTSHPAESSSSYSPQPCRQFTFSEIQLATQNFDESLVIGRGGLARFTEEPSLMGKHTWMLQLSDWNQVLVKER